MKYKKPKAKLTTRQEEVYGYLVEYSNRNGYMPSQDEIAQLMGVKNRSTSVAIVDSLVQKMYLIRNLASRALWFVNYWGEKQVKLDGWVTTISVGKDVRVRIENGVATIRYPQHVAIGVVRTKLRG